MTNLIKAAVLAATLVSGVGASLAASSRPHDGAIERRVTYYRDGWNPPEVVGYSIYYCDGYVETSGMITGAETEEYFGCS